MAGVGLVRCTPHGVGDPRGVRRLLGDLEPLSLTSRREAVARRSPPVRTFASEAKRLIRECGLEEPTAAQPGDALTWVLFSTGHFKKRRHHRHGKPYRPRAFFDGTYEPRTR